MRNLKKFLALVLAMMMTLSLMVTVNAKDITADFTDAESVTEEFQEAVDVLNGMKVFEGYTDGTFQPKGEITRAEVATIVYRLATGDAEGIQAHLYKDYQKFTDVNGDHWAAGYINYCANAEWIAGYGNGKFGPSDKVTGYQAAAMILRAVGYGKNNEFVGPTWQVQVANVTRSEYLLVNVDNTTYANTLNQPATRELVAEILFQAANIPTVTWTMLGGYSKTSNALNIGDTNPSLGVTNYGLVNFAGIVVDNQETKLNETWTSFNISETSAYNYSATSGSDNVVLRMKWDTELKDFGRAYNVWYDNRGSLHTVYAAYDESTAYKVVFDNSTLGAPDNAAPSLTASTAAGQDDLGSIAQSVGFKLNAAKTAYVSNGYADFHTYKGAVSQGTPYESPQHMYVLLSNSSNKTLDVVISLNVEATKITAVNNNVVDATKNISVPYYAKALNGSFTGFVSAIENTLFLGTNTAVVVGGTESINSSANNPAVFSIYQNKLTANSSTTLQDYVIGNAIMKDSGDDIAAADIVAYNTKAAMDKKTGTVTAFHVNTTWSNTDPDYVIVNGEKIEKSPLYMTVPAGNNTATANTVIPQVGNGVPANEQYTNSQYEFYLDGDGKYIGAKPLGSNDFIYGTYVDYTQELNSSTFKYYMTGIDKDGKIITKPVSTRGTAIINSVSIQGSTSQPVPYRDNQAGSVNGLGEGLYSAFTLIGEDISSVGGITTANDGIYVAGMLHGAFDDPVTINKDAKTLGAVDVDPDNGSNAIDNNLYFTEKTKFILVEGFGTGSLKTTVRNGISDLLGENSSVTINLTTGNQPGGSTTDGYVNRPYHYMTYMETSPFIYAQTVGVTARQADIVILPKDAVTFNSSNGLYYVGSNAPTLFDAPSAGTNATATQFTMYDAEGNKVSMWIQGDSRQGASATNFAEIVGNASNADRFYDLRDTGKTTLGGEPVYSVVAHNSDAAATGTRPTNGVIDKSSGQSASGLYVARTQDSLNATIVAYGTSATDGLMYNVANAKVVNLSTKYPGISDLASLNASSANLNQNVFVSCVLDKDNPLIVNTIFVCYGQ